MRNENMIQTGLKVYFTAVVLLMTNSSFYCGKTLANAIDVPEKNISYPNRNGSKSLGTASSTLEGIIEESVTYHPGIEADKHALSASDDGVDQAIAAYLPSVDVRMSAGRETTRRDFPVSPLNPLSSVGKLSLTRTDPSISVKQVLFDGMGTASRVDRARSQRLQARGNLGVTRDGIMIDAATVAVDIRRLQRLYRITLKNIEFHQAMRDKVNKIVQAGATSIADLYQVESRLQDTHVSRSNIVSDLEMARAKFIEIVGKEPPAFIEPVSLPDELTVGSEERIVRLALDNNNAIKVAKSNVKIAEANYNETASKLLPTVSFEMEAEKDRNVGGTVGTQDRFTAIVVARHNLFSGGADMSKSRETAKKKSEAGSRLDFARRQIEHTVRAAWGQMYNAHSKSAYLRKLAEEKRLIRNTYVQEFSLGRRSLIDILDSANDVFTTQAAHISSDATADTNAMVIIIATGQFKKFLRSTKGTPHPSSRQPMNLSLLRSASFMPTSFPSEKASRGLGNETGTDASAQTSPPPQTRKSIFEKRKALRQKALQEQ